jgi:hypothetical protein
MKFSRLSLVAVLGVSACVQSTPPATTSQPQPEPEPDRRVALAAGVHDAGEAAWNLKVVSETPSPSRFAETMNSDLAFTGNYAIQGNFNGFQVYDISTPSSPRLVKEYFCPASQSDVSVYRNLLFVSGEGLEGRLDCGGQGVQDTVSKDRLRGLRIFDISDITNPRYVGNVQTCRGSHTHSVVEDPNDRENVYVYISGSAPPRSPNELAGCVGDPNAANTSLFRIEVIKVPLANPSQAAIVSSPRIFEELSAPPRHGPAPADAEAARKRAEAARAAGGYTAIIQGQDYVLPPPFIARMLDSLVKARGGTGSPTAADSATLRTNIQTIVDKIVGANSNAPQRGPTQCHDITVYPALGLAGGACEGYGFLLDIRNPTNPVRIDAVSDSNFAYWHSATFNNDGTKVIFTDEWGGGTQPKCRATDKPEWGANAIFTIGQDRQMTFRSYYKLPVPQTPQENCVAHNGSLIPIPDRDIMVQAWYQGGVSIFEFTDPANPKEIAYFDRGPLNAEQMAAGGSWSAYWYNGHIFSSEIARGLDVVELTPSEFISQNEIDAAKTVHLDYFNAQGQPKLNWPPSFALARAYVDQLERSKCLPANRIATVRQELSAAETASATQRRDALMRLASSLDADIGSSCDGPKKRKLQSAIRDLSAVMP